MVNLLGPISLNQTYSPSPSSYQLPTAPHLGVDLVCPSPNHARMLIGLIMCKSCPGNYSYCKVIRSTTRLCSEGTVLSSLVWSLILTIWCLFQMSHIELSTVETLILYTLTSCGRLHKLLFTVTTVSLMKAESWFYLVLGRVSQLWLNW